MNIYDDDWPIGEWKPAPELGIAEDGQLGFTVPDSTGQLELIPAPAPIDTRTIEQRAADAAREVDDRRTA